MGRTKQTPRRTSLCHRHTPRISIGPTRSIPLSIFQSIVREMFGTSKLGMSKKALMTLYEATELYMIELFKDSNLRVLNSNPPRITLRIQDLQLAYRIRNG